jgi:hypothetical protein
LPVTQVTLAYLTQAASKTRGKKSFLTLVPGEEDGGFAHAVGGRSCHAPVDSTFDGDTANQGPVTLAPTHDVDNLAKKKMFKTSTSG